MLVSEYKYYLNNSHKCNMNLKSKGDKPISSMQQPQRPNSMWCYSFGSLRAGNKEFIQNFNSLIRNGSMQEVYHVVNNADTVARLP